ncbi:peptidase inhibitor family I36 protein [Streptomyces virginiae]|uniref:peptidase inhibitor family I36 protein n=1 Tax=Streptomyces virginiae TaxID=1961 RepID=UPI0035D72DDC
MHLPRVLALASSGIALTAAPGRGHPRPGPACAGSTGSAVTAPQDQIQCPRGYVCIYTEIHFEGRPHVSPARGSSRRTSRRSTKRSCAEHEARRLRAEC